MAEHSSLSHPDEHFVNKGLFHIVSLAKDKNKAITRARNTVLNEEYAALKTRLDDAGFPNGVTSMFVPLTEKSRKRLSRLYRKYSATDSELGRRIVLLHDLAAFMDDIISRGLVRPSRVAIPTTETELPKTELPTVKSEHDEPSPAVPETKDDDKSSMDIDTCSCKKHLEEFVSGLYQRYVHMEGEKARLASERDAMYKEMNARMERMYTTQKREREKDSADLVRESLHKRARTVDEFVNHFTGR